MRETFKRVTVTKEDGGIQALHARFVMFLKQGELTENSHALLKWYENDDDAMVDNREKESYFVVPLANVYFDDTPEY